MFGAAALAAACTLLAPASRVRDGQLYRTGESSYDDYFKTVHDIQEDAADWADAGRAARKPLTDALTLTSDASDSTIAQVAHEQIEASLSSLGSTKLEVHGENAHFVASSGSHASIDALAVAIESTVHAELERAKKMKAMTPKIDVLLQSGEALEPHVAEDFRKVGLQKPVEVRQELKASYDVLSSASYQARREARAAEAFVADLQRAVAFGADANADAPSGSTPPSAKSSGSKADKGEKHTQKPSPPSASPHPSQASPRPASAPAPPKPPAADPPPAKPASPKPAPAGESFDP